MFKPAEMVTIKSGFWKGHDGAIENKVSALPIYRVYIAWAPLQGPTRLKDALANTLFATLPSSHWMWSWQLKSYEKPRKLTEQDMVIEAAKYLRDHDGTILNPNHEIVKMLTRDGYGYMRIPVVEEKEKTNEA